MATAQVLRPGPVGQPDIGYAPDHDKWLARTKKRLETENLEKTIPDGFPTKLESDLVWEGDTIANEYNWVYELKESEVEEIEKALHHFKSLNKPLGFVDQDTFPLPKLHAALRYISEEIHVRRGFKVLRGLPVQKHTREDNIIIYAGVSSHIAPVRGRQDNRFENKPADVVIHHVKDLSTTTAANRIGSPAYTADKQVFHTDSGDIVSLFCLNTAAEGGQSKLSSSWRVYNELAKTRPDLIRTLSEPWIVEEFGNPNRQFSVRPLLHYQSKTETTPERLIIQYARRSLTGYQALPRSANIPPITEAQAEALDALHFLAEKFSVGLDFRQGDVQYVNNLSIFHARDGFKDTPEQQRHLVRLWLQDPEHRWKIPTILQERWDKVYKDVKPENSVFPLEPGIRSASDGHFKQEPQTNGDSNQATK